MSSKKKWEIAIFILAGLIFVFILGAGTGIFFVQSKSSKTPLPAVGSSLISHVIHLTDKQNQANDSFNSAIEVKSGYETQSSLLSGSDVDYYFFQVIEPSNVRISFKDLPNEYSTYVYNSNRKIIASSVRSGFTASAGLIKIANPGKYYIQVYSNKNSAGKLPYSITVTILPIFDTSNQ